MKWKQLRLGLVAVILATGWFCQSAIGATPNDSGASVASEPMMLDLSHFFWERFVTPERTNHEMVSVSGRQVFDGLPFQVDGRAVLYGRALASQRKDPAWPRSAYPDILGVKVGRAFDELHLLHATQFTDLEGEVVATVRFNYADGNHLEFPMAYGVHVRDWQHLQSEAKEIYTDPETKVIWRGPGVKWFKSTTRMSKTRLVNPFPSKVVATIDFVSNGRVASYDVAAATVANRDPNRPVTPPIPLDRPERNFDASLMVRVVDEADRPIEGVLVEPNISVAGSAAATVTTPFYTAADGSGTLKYPKNESAWIYFCASKEGWRRAPNEVAVHYSRLTVPLNVIVATIRMVRDGPVPSPGATFAAQSPTSGPSTASATRVIASTSRQPLLIIDFPAGSDVRVEFKDDLNEPAWQPLTVITNLPSAPYPFVCGEEAGAGRQRFYRAVLAP